MGFCSGPSGLTGEMMQHDLWFQINKVKLKNVVKKNKKTDQTKICPAVCWIQGSFRILSSNCLNPMSVNLSKKIKN